MHDVVIAGASGFLGGHLRAAFEADGRRVRTIGRRSADATWEDQDGIRRLVDGASLVINLAGRSVNCRYTDTNREEILRSRVDTTRALGEAIGRASTPPPLWLNASTATIYRHSTRHAHTEHDAPGGHDFSEQVALAWERALFDAPTPATRRVAMRTAIVLAADSPATRTLLRLARLGLGGPQLDGSWLEHDRYRALDEPHGTKAAKHESRAHGTHGRQRFSWIHVDDVVGAVRHIEHVDSLRGPVNLAAPVAVTNAQLMALLRHVVRAKVGIPAPRWVLEPAMWALRTESELLLKSRWVAPAKLIDSGYRFQQPRLDWALRDIWARLRTR